MAEVVFSAPNSPPCRREALRCCLRVNACAAIYVTHQSRFFDASSRALARARATKSGCAPMRVPLWTIDWQTAWHSTRDGPREVARGVVGQRAHVRHELVHDIVGQDHAVEQRVALGEDAREGVEHRSLKLRLELARIIGEQLDVRLAIVLDESAKCHDGSIMTVGP